MSILRNVRILNLSGATTGTAAATTSLVYPVDMQNYNGCLFIGMSATTSWGTAQDMFISEAATTAATFVSLETGGGAVASGAAADSTSVSFLAIDVYKPNDRYLNVGFTSGTIGCMHRVIAIQYDPKIKAVTQSTDTPVYEPFVPATGIVCVASPTTA